MGNKSKLPLDGYVRVSRKGDREGDTYIAPKVQEKAIRAGAKIHRVKVGEVVWDEDVSGATRPEDRKLEYLLKKCESGISGGIMVHRLDRLSRSTRHTLDAVARLEAAGGRLIGITDGVDTSTPSGELVITILAGLAREQWKRYQENWETAKGDAIGRGIHIASTIPFGFHRETNEKGELNGPLVPTSGPDELVRETFRLRAEEGYSYTRLCQWLEEQTGRPWFVPTVRKMLSNPVYLGVAFNGAHRKEGAHPAPVSRTLFDAVQSARSVHRPRRADSIAGRTLLNGLLRCAGCGYRMQIIASTSLVSRKTGARSDPQPFYACKRSRTECSERAGANAAKLDGYVDEFVIDAFNGDGPVAEAVAAQDRLADAQDAVAEAERELDGFVNNPRLLTMLGEQKFEGGVESRQAAYELAQADLRDAKSQASLVGNLTDGNLIQAWPDLTILERRQVLTAVLDRIVVRKTRPGEALSQRVQIVWRGNVLANGNPDHAGVALTENV